MPVALSLVEFIEFVKQNRVIALLVSLHMTVKTWDRVNVGSRKNPL